MRTVLPTLDASLQDLPNSNTAAGKIWVAALETDPSSLPDWLIEHPRLAGVICKTDGAAAARGLAPAACGFYAPDGSASRMPQQDAATAVFLGLQIRNYRRFLVALYRAGVRQFIVYDAMHGWHRISALRLVVSSFTSLLQQRLIEGVCKVMGREVPSFSFPALELPGDVATFVRESPQPYAPVDGRMVLCNNGLAWGGSERQLVMTLQGLKMRGYDDLHFACDDISSADYRSFFLGTVQGLGVQIYEMASIGMRLAMGTKVDEMAEHHLPVHFDLIPAELRQQVTLYARLFSNLRPAVVHAWQDSTNIIVALAALAAGVPKIVMAARNMAPYHFAYHRPYMKSAYQALLQHAPAGRLEFLNNSHQGRTNYAEWLGVPVGSMHVVLNGVETSVWQRRPAADVDALRAALGIPLGAPVLGSVFRFYAEKDPHLWLEVATRVAKARPDAHFVVFGDGPLLPETKNIAAGRGLEDRVHLPGDNKDTTLIHSLINVFLLASRVEGTPNVLIESALIGNPVVTTAVGGAPDTVSHGATGYLSLSRDAAELANYCLELLANPAKARQMGDAGRDFATQRFGIDRMIDETLVLYGLRASSAARVA